MAGLAAVLCDEVAEAVHPNFDLLEKHGQEVKATADAMLVGPGRYCPPLHGHASKFLELNGIL